MCIGYMYRIAWQQRAEDTGQGPAETRCSSSIGTVCMMSVFLAQYMLCHHSYPNEI